MLGFHVAGLIHWEKVTCCRAGMHGCTLSRKLLSRPCYTLLNFFFFRNMKISTCALWIPLKHSLFLLDLTSLNSMVNDFKSDKSTEPGIIFRNKKEMLWQCCCIKNIIPTLNGSNTETMMMN